MTDIELERIPWATLERFTEYTITARDTLLAFAANVRAQGFALSTGERTIGAGSIAVPLLDPKGRCVASIGVSGLEKAYKEERTVAKMLVELGRVAESASRHLESWWAHHED